MNKLKSLFFAFAFFILSINFIFADNSDVSSSSLEAADSVNSLSKKTGVGQQSNFLPDAQLAMSESLYPVTAGDIYKLAFVAGTNTVSYSILVDSTYKIRIANLALIDCKGLTFIELKNKVISVVQKNYPMGGVQFVLISPAAFRVTITGEVKTTVQKSAWALTRLSTFVKESFTPYSSSRNIKIIGEDGSEKIYDLFLSDRKGDLNQDPYLRPGDKIVVNRIKRRVTINGAVERPGTYELFDNENLRDLIDYYGNGLEALADLSRMELYRPLSGDNDSGEKFYLNEESYKNNFELKCYDQITVSSYKDLMPVIFVEGAVCKNSDGSVLTSSTKIPKRFNKGEDYAFFVRRNKSMFTSVSDLENAYLIRGEQTIPLNLKTMLYDVSYYSKVELQYNDVLLVPFKQFFVNVSGAVYQPGRYPYIPDRNWDYYIGLAGGLIKEKNAASSVLITDVHGNEHKKDEFILPEMTIEAKTNSGLYYFNQYAPVITTLLSAISTSITIMVVTGVIR